MATEGKELIFYLKDKNGRYHAVQNFYFAFNKETIIDDCKNMMDTINNIIKLHRKLYSDSYDIFSGEGDNSVRFKYGFKNVLKEITWFDIDYGEVSNSMISRFGTCITIDTKTESSRFGDDFLNALREHKNRVDLSKKADEILLYFDEVEIIGKLLDIAGIEQDDSPVNRLNSAGIHPIKIKNCQNVSVYDITEHVDKIIGTKKSLGLNVPDLQPAKFKLMICQ